MRIAHPLVSGTGLFDGRTTGQQPHADEVRQQRSGQPQVSRARGEAREGMHGTGKPFAPHGWLQGHAEQARVAEPPERRAVQPRGHALTPAPLAPFLRALGAVTLTQGAESLVQRAPHTGLLSGRFYTRAGRRAGACGRDADG